MTDRARVAVLGASGFAGAELLRRLLRHPEVTVTHVVADEHLGQPVADAHPHLEGLTELRFEPFDPARAARADFILMGLPPEASFQVVRAAQGSAARIIDLSGAFRLKDPGLFETYYGRPHPLPELLPDFVYGLPEQNRDRIQGARYVASPGCFATTLTLGLLPFARAGWLTGAIRTVAVTGSSGAGKEPSPTTHHPTRAGNVRTYRPLLHPHAPEVASTLELAGATNLQLDFVPVSGPYVRGIFATSFVQLPRAVSREAIDEALAQSYAKEPFVRVPRGRLPEVVAVAGSCYAEVGYTLAESSLVVFSTLDNLIKGGAGQAIQNLNLMLGIDETTTLSDPGPYP